MRLLADECCEAALVDALRAAGHDVLFAVESLRGEPDDEVLSRAFAEDRVLITEDKDFGELVYRLRIPAHALILLRFGVSDRALKISRLLELLDSRAQNLSGTFVVLESDKIRIRRLSAS